MHGDTELAAWPLAACERVDLTLVHRVARLQLAARRAGYSIRLREAPATLCQLLDLVGLANAVPCSTAPLSSTDPLWCASEQDGPSEEKASRRRSER